MPKITIDNQELEIEDGFTIMQACKMAGQEIPHFCFHERLNIAGNCRMCLVEVEKNPKLVASCAMPISDGMIIHTNSAKVKEGRAGVMEFLLINHPLDCPICDQGGECDLQDQAFKYGKGEKKFHENKRAVPDKYMGPLVETHMTRCIHCTRCIRFSTEVAGIAEIGTIGRGENMEISTYLQQTLTSELSGNIIDLCPVGALTSKPYAFKARSWELQSTESIDILDALGSNIRVDNRGLEVMRILPKINEDINEEWISDKARFSYDGLKNQRLDKPYIKKNGKLVEASWAEAIAVITEKLGTLKGDELAGIAGQLACVESMFLLKKLLNSLGCFNLDANQHNYKFDKTARANYLFNTTLSGIEKADVCLLIGANPRKVAPILNARIIKAYKQNGLFIARIGGNEDQNYHITELGNDPNILVELADGKHEFTSVLQNAKYPIIIVGDGVYTREDGHILLSYIHQIVAKNNIVKSDFNGFNILHNHASMVGSLDIGFTEISPENNIVSILNKAQSGQIKFVYLLGADEIDTTLLNNCFVVYQGHHGDAGASIADVILPGAAYTEKSATFVNLEGRVQITHPAVPPPGDAKEDWRIIRDIAASIGINFNILSLPDLRKELAKFSEVFNNSDNIIYNEFNVFKYDGIIENKQILDIPINYYMTDVISRNSITMAKCTLEQKMMIK